MLFLKLLCARKGQKFLVDVIYCDFYCRPEHWSVMKTIGPVHFWCIERRMEKSVWHLKSCYWHCNHVLLISMWFKDVSREVKYTHFIEMPFHQQNIIYYFPLLRSKNRQLIIPCKYHWLIFCQLQMFLQICWISISWPSKK